MIIKTYGDERLPKILGLHPMMASGESMLRVAGSLRERYCVIAPDLTGQGEDTGTFVSAEAEAGTLHDWLLDKGWTRMELIYGASLGAAVALELMAMTDLEVGTAVFDGCPLYKNAPFLKWMMTTVFVPPLPGGVGKKDALRVRREGYGFKGSQKESPQVLSQSHAYRAGGVWTLPVSFLHGGGLQRYFGTVYT